MTGHVWLIGLMGSGKTAIGAALAAHRGLPFYDVDERIEAEYGREVTDIFFLEGEDEFRAMESNELKAVAAEPDGVVATGGGAIIVTGNVDTMRSHGTVVLLEVDPETAARRIQDAKSRPLLAGGTLEVLADLLAERTFAYRKAADVVVDANDDIDTVVGRVEDACGM